jgi:hypothetical protein
MNTIDNSQLIVDSLSIMIAAKLKTVADESFYPSSDADRSDDIIKHAKENASELRRIRSEFENLIYSQGMVK